MSCYGEKRVPLSLDQQKDKKRKDWKFRRTLRVIQVRQQAKCISREIREEFWGSVYHLEEQRLDQLKLEKKIEDDLVLKRKQVRFFLL